MSNSETQIRHIVAFFDPVTKRKQIWVCDEDSVIETLDSIWQACTRGWHSFDVAYKLSQRLTESVREGHSDPW